MTYCLAMRLRDGLVLLSDTRTNAGVDNVSNYKKLFCFHPTPHSTIVLQSAGNLATTQQVLHRVERDLETDAEESLRTVTTLFEAALYVGRISTEVVNRHKPALDSVGADATSTFLLSGQIGDAPPDVFLVYPEGNYITVSDERPFLQIGETKYGKFLLEVGSTAHLDLEDAAKVALSSMISTAHANLSVGPPYDLGIYRNGSQLVEHSRIEADSPYLRELQEVWAKHMQRALDVLPMVHAAESKSI